MHAHAARMHVHERIGVCVVCLCTIRWADLGPPSAWQGYTPTLDAWKEFAFLMLLCAGVLVSPQRAVSAQRVRNELVSRAFISLFDAPLRRCLSQCAMRCWRRGLSGGTHAARAGAVAHVPVRAHVRTDLRAVVQALCLCRTRGWRLKF